MNAAALHSLAEVMGEAFMHDIVTVTKEERVVELAGAQWLGMWEGFVLFRDPLTCSTCSSPVAGFTVAGVLAKLESKRKEFGL